MSTKKRKPTPKKAPVKKPVNRTGYSQLKKAYDELVESLKNRDANIVNVETIWKETNERGQPINSDTAGLASLSCQFNSWLGDLRNNLSFTSQLVCELGGENVLLNEFAEDKSASFKELYQKQLSELKGLTEASFRLKESLSQLITS